MFKGTSEVHLLTHFPLKVIEKYELAHIVQVYQVPIHE